MVDVFTKGGLLYEPKVLASRFAIQSQEGQGVLTNAQRGPVFPGPQAVLNLTEYRNGSRYPVELTHMILCGLGYALRTTNIPDLPSDISLAAAARTYRNDMANLYDLTVQVTTPYRNRLQNLEFHGNSASPSPVTPLLPLSGANGPTPYASSVYGTSSWWFDRPCGLVRNAIVQFSMGSFTYPFAGPPTGNLSQVPRGAYSFFGQGIRDGQGRFGGEGRTKEPFQLQGLANGSAPQARPWPVGFPATAFDAWGAGNGPGAVQATTPWPPQQEFTTKEWLSQESDRGGVGTHLEGFNVMLDQGEYDTFLYDAVTSSIPALANCAIAPFSTRMGARCRTKNAGTGQWWWPENTPLCLVTPSQGPGATFKFDSPITLGPGESLQVTVRLPQSILNFEDLNLSPEATLNPFFQYGLSFCGYSVVEG